MWYFSSPLVVFGEDALSHLDRLSNCRACLVTDANLVRLGFAGRIRSLLEPNGVELRIFDAVESDPSLETVQRGAQLLLEFNPQWIIALGGGSVMDAAKAMWVLYERPDVTPESINPVEEYGLRAKAKLIAIPTTAGTGAEVTWAIVLTDTAERRKLGLGSRENIPDIAILDPELVRQLPPRLTADTGLDALTHAVEGFTNALSNDFCDGMCLQAIRLLFEYLPRCYQDGDDLEARTKVQNAATMAGLGFGNSMAALAHGMGHSLGGVFHVPHGRAVALFLPYTIEYCVEGDPGNTRYREIARYLGLPAADEPQAAASLSAAIRDLERQLGQPLTLAECGIPRADFERELDLLVQNALTDGTTVMASRVPEDADLRALFLSAYGSG